MRYGKVDSERETCRVVAVEININFYLDEVVVVVNDSAILVVVTKAYKIMDQENDFYVKIIFTYVDIITLVQEINQRGKLHSH